MSKDKNQIAVIEKDDILNGLKEAAESGLPDAKYEMALIYLEREETDQAIKLLEESYNEFHKSSLKLGDMHTEGKYVKADPKKALKYYLKAYELGDDQAAFKLGVLHSHEKYSNYGFYDKDKAIKYFEETIKLKSNAHDSEAYFYLGELYFAKGKFEKAQANLLQSYEHYKNPKAAKSLGIIYFEGKIKEFKDLNIAYKFLKFASENGDGYSTYILSKYYLNGLGKTEKNVEKALELLEKASDLGYLDAIFDLAELYLNPKFEKYDSNQAIIELKRLAIKDHNKAQHKLAQVHTLLGNNDEALSYLEQSSNNGNHEATFDLATKILSNCKLDSEKSFLDSIYDMLFNTNSNLYCSKGISLLDNNARNNKHSKSIVTLLSIYEKGLYKNSKVSPGNQVKLKEILELGKINKLPSALFISSKIILENINEDSNEGLTNLAISDLIYASDKGNHDSMLYYAQNLILGKTVPYNPNLAEELLVKAANEEHYHSQYFLGKEGFEKQNPIKCKDSLNWLLKAHYNIANPEMEFMQSILNKYNINDIFIHDHESFKKAYKQISLHLHPDKISNLKSIVTIDEVNDDLNLVKEIYKESYNLSDLPETKNKIHDDVELMIAQMHFNGCKDLQKDTIEAKKWYSSAIKKGNQKAKLEYYLKFKDELNTDASEISASESNDKSEL
jgi:TPR repeat protein